MAQKGGNPNIAEHGKKHQFQKGNTEARKKAKIFTQLKGMGFDTKEIKESFGKIALLTENELKKVWKDPDTPMLIKIVAKAIKKAEETGELRYIKEILEYSVGKPKEEIEVTNVNPYDDIPDHVLEDRLKDIESENNDAN